ncbi:hypothetical protein NKJ64_18080 [Mesorhizobium sp. M0062]|uniref:hypothetical protein n=1 Tax=Mesorhizobium sp. M0062 TaxID=2956867 RepID=UPI003337D835
MNFRRGMFRIWTVASICWLIFVGVVTYGEFQRQMRLHNTLNDVKAGYSIGLPCPQAVGQLGVDYVKDDRFGQVLSEQTGTKTDWCSYSLAGYRKAHPEDSGKSDEQIFNENLVFDNTHPWRSIGFGVLAGVTGPLALLLLWFIGAWVVTGFRSREPGAS